MPPEARVSPASPPEARIPRELLLKKKFILTLGLCGLLLVTGCTDSNENKDKNKDNEENRSYASKVTCEAENTKYIFYFDKNDQLESFDLYSTINIVDFDMTEKQIKEQAEDIIKQL